MKNLSKPSVRAWKSAAVALTFGLGLSLLPSMARADVPGRHPHYLHALSDLRLARAYVTGQDERNVMGDEMNSLVHIDRAIGDIKSAAIDDRKNLRDHPPIDVTLNRRDRLQRARELLVSARNDLSIREDDNDARGWRQAALDEISAALGADRQAISTNRRDDRRQGQHPGYLRALSDLRLARAYVTGEDENNVMGDEMQALVQIDNAIKAIRRAAVDDGKNLRDHPPIDTTLRHRDRLQRAQTLLSAAHADLTREEDDPAARGWRRVVVGNVDSAFRSVRQAMTDDRRDDRRDR